MTNGFTTAIGILLLILIVLAIRYILMHGSKKNAGCTGSCSTCGIGCMSRYSMERDKFERVMREAERNRNPEGRNGAETEQR